ncbi:MAG: STAS domain-containing protein [Polyangiaceae bacterium]|jgi:anti-sigma B factor antagonist|nr:STAS domain-containing protein [Polyangiaceae bacterium]
MSTVTSKRAGGVLVVELEGRIDAAGAELLEERLLDLIDHGDHKLVVGLDHVHHIDSSGLGVLLAVLKRARPAGGDVRLFGVNTPIQPVFRITGMRRVFRIFDSEESAVQSF